MWFDCWPFWGTVIWNSINFKFLLGNLVLIIDSIENLGTIPQYHLWFIVAKPILFFNALFYAFGPIGGCQLLVQTLDLFHLRNDRLCLGHSANLLSCAFVNLCCAFALRPCLLFFLSKLFYSTTTVLWFSWSNLISSSHSGKKVEGLIVMFIFNLSWRFWVYCGSRFSSRFTGADS